MLYDALDEEDDEEVFMFPPINKIPRLFPGRFKSRIEDVSRTSSSSSSRQNTHPVEDSKAQASTHNAELKNRETEKKSVFTIIGTNGISLIQKPSLVIQNINQSLYRLATL